MRLNERSFLSLFQCGGLSVRSLFPLSVPVWPVCVLFFLCFSAKDSLSLHRAAVTQALSSREEVSQLPLAGTGHLTHGHCQYQWMTLTTTAIPATLQQYNCNVD